MKHRGPVDSKVPVGGVVLLAVLGTAGLAACGAEADSHANTPESEISSPGISSPSASGTAKSTTAPAPAQSATSAPTTPSPEPTPVRASDPSWDPDSIHVLVNSQNPLQPADYAPDDLVELDLRTSVEYSLYLRQEAANASKELFSQALEEDISLAATSAYRSFDAQEQVYINLEVHRGTEEADEVAARPGYSEHQTGLAVDVISIDNPECITGDCFAETVEGIWVAENAHEYGFIIRYPEGAEDITGYTYEPWHLRYVGEDTAEEVFEQEVTLEEYWSLPPAPDYRTPEPELKYDHLHLEPQ